MKNIKFFAVLSALFLFTLNLSAQTDSVFNQITLDVKRIVGTDSITPEEMNRILKMLNYRIKATETLSIPTSAKGVSGGVAPLNSSGQVPVTHIPVHLHSMTQITDYVPLDTISKFATQNPSGGAYAKKVDGSYAKLAFEDETHDNQSLSLNERTLNIQGGNSVILPLADTSFRQINTNLKGGNNAFLSQSGTYNVSLGDSTLMFSSETTSDNTAIGHKSLMQATGIENIALGRESLSENVIGEGNTAIGHHTLKKFMGNNTTAIGAYALTNLTTGIGNMAIGYAAMLGTTTGRNNTAIGNGALFQLSTGRNNVGVGGSALNMITTAYDNIGIGFGATRFSNGNGNIGIGTYSTSGTTTGTSNVGIGGYALSSNQVGSNNTAIGISAGNNITGNNNTAIGYNTQVPDPTANNQLVLGTRFIGYADGHNELPNRTKLDTLQISQNAAIGKVLTSDASGNALWQTPASGGDPNFSTVGTTNVKSGLDALYNNTTGVSNTATGVASLNQNTTGYWNSGVGFKSLNKNTTGYQNSAVGSQALSSNTIGYNNIAMGVNSLLYNTTGNNNVSFGVAALGTVTNGSENVAMGSFAGNNLVSGSNNVLIGFNANLPSTTGSNQLSIMNKIYIDGNGNFVFKNVKSYASDAAADADTTLPSQAFYKITGSRVLYQKP
jgi:hypothetical protein